MKHKNFTKICGSCGLYCANLKGHKKVITDNYFCYLSIKQSRIYSSKNEFVLIKLEKWEIDALDRNEEDLRSLLEFHHLRKLLNPKYIVQSLSEFMLNDKNTL